MSLVSIVIAAAPVKVPPVNLSRDNVHTGGRVGCMDDDLVDLSHAI